MNIAVVAITRHGIALGGRVAAALPGAQLFAPEKFRALAEAAAPANCSCYTGKTGDQIPALFTAFDGIVAIVSLGAMVRLIAPHLKSKDIDPAVIVLDNREIRHPHALRISVAPMRWPGIWPPRSARSRY